MPSQKLQLVRNGPVPIYEQIARHLQSRIESGELVPGQKLPGIKMLAKSLGVNHLTLRQALRLLEENHSVVTESARGTFVATPSTTQRKIAFILPNLNESSSRISSGAQEVCSTSKSTLDIFHNDENDTLESEQINRLTAEQYDGAIIFPSLRPNSMRALLQLMLAGYPLVFIDRAPAQLPCWSVWADNFRGGYLATEHLIKKKCRRIATINNPTSAVHDRYEGFLRAMGDHKLPVDYNLVRTVEQHNEPIEAIIDEWMQLPQPPQGILLANDFQAFRALRRLNELGKSVPREVRIIGFDDLSICELASPTLTTIRQDFAGIGRRAVELLQQQINTPKDKRHAQNQQALVPVSLVERGSA